MKRIKNFMATVLSLVFMASIANAQTISEQVSIISGEHEALLAKVNEANTGSVSDYKAWIGEVEGLFEKVKKSQVALGKKFRPAEKKKFEGALAGMEKSYANADKHLKNLKTEAGKPKPSIGKLKQSIKFFVSQISEAEKNNQQISG
ncbi:hypothetical protein RCC89_16235 [Cytophagaceae bacterium ABcell3]|nr:hypothetical protein RCC89_16235 [Cytophagaceae bacterium ABcell3]